MNGEDPVERSLKESIQNFFGPTPADVRIDAESADDMLSQLASQVATRLGKRDRIRIPAGLARAHRVAIRRNRRRLDRRIRDLLGTLAERYGAQHAWMCVPVGQRTWRACFSFRRQLQNQVVKLNERCILSHVIETRQAYLAADTERDPFYKAENPATRSQLAAPVLVNGPGPSERIIGVVNFESETCDNFSTEQLAHLANDAQEFAVPLLCLEALVPGDYSRWPFNPDRHGWVIDRILKDMCDEFTQAVSAKSDGADLSTTVWHADWVCQELWARGTSGYSFEYLRRSLPFDSFTGQGAQRSSREPLLRDTPEHPGFHERDKASRMGLKRLMSCPIDNPEGSFRSLGAVNVYQFLRDVPNRLPSDNVVRNFARMVGEVTINLERLRASIVSSHLAWEMQRSARLADSEELIAAQFHALKEALHRYFAANGCSLYVPDETEKDLTIVASTGTRGERLRWHEGRWVCQTREPGSYKLTERGVMQYLFFHPGKALILNDVNRLAELRERIDPELPDTIVTKGLEHLTPDTTARRFLGIGVRIGGHNWMVVRLTRSTEHAPFTKFDGKLLENLARLCRENEFWIPPSQHSIVDPEAGARRYTGAPAAKGPWPASKPALQSESSVNSIEEE